MQGRLMPPFVAEVFPSAVKSPVGPRWNAAAGVAMAVVRTAMPAAAIAMAIFMGFCPLRVGNCPCRQETLARAVRPLQFLESRVFVGSSRGLAAPAGIEPATSSLEG